MGEMVDRDLEHLRLLKIGFFIQAGVSAAFTVFGVLYTGVLAWATAKFPSATAADANVNTELLPYIFLGMAAICLVMGISTAAVCYYSGRCVERHRRRTFVVVMAGLGCLQIPYGTAFGIAAIAVLSRPSVKALFEAPLPATL